MHALGSPCSASLDPPARVAFSLDGFRIWGEAPMQVDGLGIDAQPELWPYALDTAGRGWAGTDSSLRHSRVGARSWRTLLRDRPVRGDTRITPAVTSPVQRFCQPCASVVAVALGRHCESSASN